jgi:hypothetical protein
MANTSNVVMHVTFHDESLKLRKEFIDALEEEYSYDYFDDSTSHQIGYYLAIASVVGFSGVLFSIRRMGKNDY